MLFSILYGNEVQKARYSSKVSNLYIDKLEYIFEFFLLTVNLFFTSFSGIIRVTVNIKFPIWNS